MPAAILDAPPRSPRCSFEGGEPDRESRAIRESLACQDLRRKVAAIEAELATAREKLAGSLSHVLLDDLLAGREATLAKLRERLEHAEENARRSARRQLDSERIEELQCEADPLLRRARKALETARELLTQAAALDHQARGLGGALFAHPIDASLIEWGVARLEKPPGARWALFR